MSNLVNPLEVTRLGLHFRLALAWLCLLAVSRQLLADIPLFTTGPGTLRSRDEMRGFQFDLSQNITVTGLGKFDGNGNGLLDDTSPARVGLWRNDTNDLIASAEIDQQSLFRNEGFVTAVDPIELLPGSYTLATQVFVDEEPFTYRSDFETLPIVRNVAGRWTRGNEFQQPTSSTSRIAFGPNLIIEQPTILVSEPSTHTVSQRGADNQGMISFAGQYDPAQLDSIEVRAVPMDGFTGSPTPWQLATTTDEHFAGGIKVPAGWYQLETRGLNGGEQAEHVVVPKVGVGEVFVIAGQSNSANSGERPAVPGDDRVVTMTTDGTWRHGADPQPIATGGGGSPWPHLGDLLVDRLDVPVGFVSVGWGGTRVDQWLPGAPGPDLSPLYDRLQWALQQLGPDGARAVLWHQGESDSASATSTAEYIERLNQVIAQSRSDAGYDIPWGIARAAFLPGTTLEAESAILDAQQAVIDADPLVFAGPLTDDLIGSEWRYDQIHFNQAGLEVHGQRWFAHVLPIIVPEPVALLPTVLWGIVAARAASRKRLWILATDA